MTDRDRNNCKERVINAIHSLVTGRDIRQRLRFAYQTLLPLRRDDFPTHLRGEFDEIMSRIQPRESGVGSARDPMYRMRTTTAERIAERIVNLLWGLT